jgi:hypothetical protein
VSFPHTHRQNKSFVIELSCGHMDSRTAKAVMKHP